MGDPIIYKVSVIDPSTLTEVSSIPTADYPSGFAYEPNSKNMYTTLPFNNTVSVIDTTKNSLVSNLTAAGTYLYGIAYNPDNKYLYVTDSENNAVLVVDTSENIQPPTNTSIT